MKPINVDGPAIPELVACGKVEIRYLRERKDADRWADCKDASDVNAVLTAEGYWEGVEPQNAWKRVIGDFYDNPYLDELKESLKSG